MEGGEVGVAFGEGEGAEGEADGDVVQGVGGGDVGEREVVGMEISGVGMFCVILSMLFSCCLVRMCYYSRIGMVVLWMQR